MAVRTSVGRAATEAHMRTLSDAGIDLVIVSDAPRECPLCRRWEGKVLTIGGPDGEREVEVKHAVEDGRMVRVRVAGSLDAARLAGLQHPNCRHSVSAYTPGLTTVEQAESDPASYEAGQRQRAIERNIRKYKRREAAAITPEAQRAARLKVRQWQGAMRDHLAAHPDLRRLRAREQPGASNLPEQRTEASEQQVDAARVWSGDDQAVREMSDDQLAAALGSGLLDDRARARIEAEADRRDLDDRLARMFPARQLLADLTDASDDDLAWAMQQATNDEVLRIAAELERRNGPRTLPPPADTDDAADDLLADHNALADVLAPAPNPDGWGALADDAVWAATVGDDQADTAPPDDQAEDGSRITRKQAREMYDEYVYLQFLKAEEDCNGYLLNKKGQAAGWSAQSLFRGPARIAYANASDELKEWWSTHGRLTQAEFIEKATGQTQRWATAARFNESKEQQKR